MTGPSRNRAIRRRARPLTVAACCAAAIAATAAAGGRMGIDGIIYDLALAVRAATPASPGGRPVAVVAVDEATLAAPELRSLPRALFAPHWAALIEAAARAGARAIGFDLLLAWSPSAYLPGHDRPLLEALSRHHDTVVLARTGAWPPAASYFYAVGAGQDPHATGFVELAADGDGVYRRVPATVATADGPRPSFVAAVAAKAGLGSLPDHVLLAPRVPLTSLPQYSLIDVLRCAEGDPARLDEALAGRIVLVGTTLADEDRKPAPDRFLRTQSREGPPARAEAGCALRPLDVAAGTAPGVLLHAQALHQLATDQVVASAPRPAVVAVAALAAVLGAGLGVTVGPALAAAGALVTATALFLASVALLQRLVWLPLGWPLVALAGSVTVAYGVRYLVEDRRRRALQSAFGHYLAPAVVERLLDADEPPRLGGETAVVTVMFADLSGFTALSTGLEPERLMATVNRYLSTIAEAVEAHGGYIDKFVGDAVMAVWGAPARDPEHAANAVRAGLAAVAAVAAARRRDAAAGAAALDLKIGIHSGPAVIGNVGWVRRVDYTAVGETVNLAARLESVPADYDCRIVVSGETARLAADACAFCELDLVTLKGFREPVAIYEPLGGRDAADAHAYVEGYARALAAYRARRFAEAAELWAALGKGGPPAVMAERARELVRAPPPPDWAGTWSRPRK